MAKPKADKRSSIMDRAMKEAAKEFGSSCYVAADHDKTHYGIPLGNFALEYLLSSDVLLLERSICLSGPRGSGKSALGYDIARRVVAHGGLAAFVETENKTSAPLMVSLLGEDDSSSFVRFHRVKTLDEGQVRLTSEFDMYEKLVPDKDVPLMLMLDSLVGSKSDETVGKINKDGSADKAFPKEALMISSYFGTLSDKLVGNPVLFLYTNHEKKGDLSGSPGGGPSHRNPGGAAPGFHATYHVRVVKIGNSTSKLEPGFTMKLKTEKNSMGTDRRSIEVDMKWRYEQDESGNTKQVTWFDWDKATAALLASDEVPRSVVKDIVQVTKVTNAKYNCPTLGLSGVTPSEVGKAINSNPEILAKLRVALGVFSWRVFDGSQG